MTEAWICANCREPRERDACTALCAACKAQWAWFDRLETDDTSEDAPPESVIPFFERRAQEEATVRRCMEQVMAVVHAIDNGAWEAARRRIGVPDGRAVIDAWLARDATRGVHPSLPLVWEHEP